MSLRQVFHDYPRLARESGFHIKIRANSLNLSEFGKLNVDDIVAHGRWEELESRMELVETCELQTEATKVLDRGLITLFRLAQLQVIYLRYCLAYLDRCVVVLQQQLSSALEDINRNQQGPDIAAESQKTFKCPDCTKTFISASYLSSHLRRRHVSTTSSSAINHAQSISLNIPVIKKQDETTQTDKVISKDVASDCICHTAEIAVMTEKPRTADEAVSTVPKETNHVYTQTEIFARDISCQTILQNIETRDIAVGSEEMLVVEQQDKVSTLVELEEKVPAQLLERDHRLELILERLVDQLKTNEKAKLISQSGEKVKETDTPKVVLPEPRHKKPFNINVTTETKVLPDFDRQCETSQLSPEMTTPISEYKINIGDPHDSISKRARALTKKKLLHNMSPKIPKLSDIRHGLSRKWTSLFSIPSVPTADRRDMSRRLQELAIDSETLGITDVTLERTLATLEHNREQQKHKDPIYHQIRQRLDREVQRQLVGGSARELEESLKMGHFYGGLQQNDNENESIIESITSEKSPVGTQKSIDDELISFSPTTDRSENILTFNEKLKRRSSLTEKPRVRFEDFVKAFEFDELKPSTSYSNLNDSKDYINVENITNTTVEDLEDTPPTSPKQKKENKVDREKSVVVKMPMKKDLSSHEAGVDMEKESDRLVEKNQSHVSNNQKKRTILTVDSSSSESSIKPISVAAAPRNKKKIVLSDKTEVEIPSGLIDDIPSPGKSSTSSDWDISLP